MRSLVSLNGGAYQILLQSRLLITALMLWAISGQRQTLFQWNLLALVVCSMSVYMCSWPARAWTVFNWLFLTTTYNFLQSFFPTKCSRWFPTEWNWLCHWWPFDSPACQQWGLDLADDTGSNQKLLGTLNVVLKVTVSCLAAVLTDRYTKHFKDPVYIQAIQLRLSRTLLLLTLVNWYLFLSGCWKVLFVYVCLPFLCK